MSPISIGSSRKAMSAAMTLLRPSPVLSVNRGELFCATQRK
ncbi:Uncharacterised protein [Mycobacteroides abscessus subsp. abscessus]|nr:Uncharacterised protein [Mycobacteroides abscessus subsp. abscessus]